MAVNGAASPNLRPTPTGYHLDPTRQAEYPIRLGDKLAGKDGAKNSRFVTLRYNYRPKHTYNQRSKIVRTLSSSTTLNLTLEDTPSNTSAAITYTYSGSVDPKSRSSEKPSIIALIFDSSRGEFVAEPVTTELNFNVTSGPGQKVRSHAQLDTVDDRNPESGSERGEGDLFGENGNVSDAEPPDKNNPFHYRHFLNQTNNEARAAHTTMTPSMTPLSDLDGLSPLPRNPGFTAKPKPKLNALSHPSGKPAPSLSTKQKPPRSHPVTKPAPKKPRPAAPASSSSSSLSPPTASSKQNRSPNIVVSPAPPPNTTATAGTADPEPDTDDLVIDMGSPPPVRRRTQYQLDPSAFASASHSPDVHAGHGDHRNLEEDLDLDLDADADADSDVESLRLGSPTAPPTATNRVPGVGAVVGLGVSDGGRVGNEAEEGEEEIDEEAEMDDEIMKDMEDILEQEQNDDEDEEDYEMEDLGISHRGPPEQMHMEEEESEVSEEE